MSPEGDIAMNERGTSMEIKEECLAYLGQYYKELFFGTANKRYRSMTGADLKHRLNRLSQETLNGVEKPNELTISMPCLQKYVPISCIRKNV